MAAFGLTAGSGLPLLTRITFSTCRAHLPRWIDPGTSRSVWRGSPRGSFPSIALAFPDPFTGRHPRLTFRGLLKLHSHYGPLICSPTICGLGRKASTPPVPRRRRFSATQAYRYLLRWDFHPRVFRAVRAHNGFVWSKCIFTAEALRAQRLRNGSLSTSS